MLAVNLVLAVLFVYLLLASFYFLVFATASVFPLPVRKSILNKKRKFAVLIPAYKEDGVIVEVAKDALEQSYDVDLYDIIVIADSLKPATIQQLKCLPIKLVEVEFEKSTKARALNRSMEVIGDNYNVAVVLDADNLMQQDFIDQINDSFNRGCRAVQAHRVAKNVNTSFAILDAASEEINNSIFRKGQRRLGLSSGLIGSGMAFEYAYFKKVMSEIDSVAEDKELELKLLEDEILIDYRDDVLVFDEKVQKAEVFYNQRKRWISSQFQYFFSSIGKACRLLVTRANINYFNKVYQWMHPPRVLYLGSLVFTALVVILFHPNELVVRAWLAMLVAGILSFVLAVPRKLYTMSTLKALINLPKAFLLMLMASFSSRNSSKAFIHTEHTALQGENQKQLHNTKSR